MINSLTKDFQSTTRSTDLDIVAPNVARVRIAMVNVYLLKMESTLEDRWVLIDAGIGNCAETIIRNATEFVGSSKPPEAIILTHGHFDHIGALKKLLEVWDVPVFAHRQEFPYLTGKSPYPPPDPTVGGGAMALLSFIYPNSPIDISDRLKPLPENGTLNEISEWKIIETPGHSPGHISLFRQSDKTLIAGDAFVTVKQESAISVLKQEKELNGPPSYFTCDWVAAKESIKKLADLEPEIAATGHGVPMRGEELRVNLKELAENFDKLAKPSIGRYIKEPAQTNEQGVTYLPPAFISNKGIGTILLGTLAGLIIFSFLSGEDDE